VDGLATGTHVNIEAINALAELERIGVGWEQAGEGEIRVCCPVHEDETPSVNLNVEKNLWKCHAASCGAKGDIVSFLAYSLECERGTAIADLSERYDLGLVKTISPDRVEQWHSKIGKVEVLRKELYDRGLDDQDIRRYRLGVDQGRITIPIPDEGGRYVNVRKYLPGAPGPKKMQNTRGYTGTALYPVKQLEFDQVVICGGEVKAIATARRLNPHGIGALCVTAGEGSWEPSFTPKFRGKHVYVMMDIDAGGRVAARKVAAQVCWEAGSVRIVQLPLDSDKHPKGDVNDWIAEGGTDEDLVKIVVEESQRYIHETAEDEELADREVHDVSLAESTKADMVGRRIRVEAVVAAMDTTPYLVPRTVGVSCTRDQPNCTYCPVKPLDPDEATGKTELTIKGTSMGLLELVNSPTRHQREATRSALRIPPCKVASFTVRDHYNVTDARLNPQIHHSGDNTDHVVQAGYVVSPDRRAVELNQEYRLQGRVFPHPRNQQAVLLLDTVEQSADSLTSFTPDPEDLGPLIDFRPKEWTTAGVQEALDRRYDDLEANVTRIFQRRDLHLAVDLVYHSVLYFTFDGRQQNGWSNTLILGDSSQGKSETMNRLMEHYGVGVRFDCKNATVAGLLGGVQDMGNKRQFISWGVITNNDRKLVALEEIKGTSTEVLGALTDMRSSGIAELVKIERRKAHARTRLVMISNPRSARPVSAYNYGCETIGELIGAMEDVRRFDFACVMSADEIDPGTINRLSTERPDLDHSYTTALCRLLVLWAWTRDVTEVAFEEGAESEVLQWSNKMCSSFTEHLPLVDRGTMRFKLARLSIALAALTFSTMPKDPSTILVRKCHVEYVAEWLIRLYSSPVFGYSDFTSAQTFATTIIDADVVKRSILATKHPSDLVNHLLHQQDIQLIDFQDWCDMDRDLAQKLLSMMVRKHALVRDNRVYKKTAEFISLLKKMQADGIPKGVSSDTVVKERF
jgi:hypothetical protein